MAGKMTPRKAIFVSEMATHGVGTRAAIVAGVPEASAHVTASRWLKDLEVAAAIEELRVKRAARLELTAERVLLELMRIAYYDPGKLYDEKGERIPIQLLDEDTRRAVAAVEDETRLVNGTTTRTQYAKMADKKGAAELLGKYLKLFTDRIEHDGRVTLEQLVCGQSAEGLDARG